MATGDVSVIRVIGRYQSQNIVNTLHYFHTLQVSTEIDVLEDLCTAWLLAHETAWVARHLDSYTLIGLKAFRQSGAAKVPYGVRQETAGSVVGQEEVSTCCRTITLYTDSDNHRRHGRLMLSGTATDMIATVDGAVTVTEVLALQALGTALVTDLYGTGNEYHLCIPATEILPYELITAARPRSTPASIRSRRIKRFYIG